MDSETAKIREPSACTTPPIKLPCHHQASGGHPGTVLFLAAGTVLFVAAGIMLARPKTCMRTAVCCCSSPAWPAGLSTRTNGASKRGPGGEHGVRGMQASRQQKPRRRPTARPSTAVCCGVSLARFVRVRHRSKRPARASRMRRTHVCGAARGRGRRRGNGRGVSSRRRAAFLYCIFNCNLVERYAAIAAFGVRARKLKEKKEKMHAQRAREVVCQNYD